MNDEAQPTTLRGDLAVYLDNQFGLHFRVHHIHAIMAIIERRYPDADEPYRNQTLRSR